MANQKNYYTVTEYYLKKYHHKIAKIALNANFTCPNRDGKKGFGGCIYCSKLGSGDTAGNVMLTLKNQFEEIKNKIHNKWPDCHFIAYLQANSNTYAPLEQLKKIYETILSLDEKIVGLSIATRPDCFSKATYDYLEKLNQRIPITIELGLQTSNPVTALKINRCSTNEEFIRCVQELNQRNIEVVVHIINGLPGETEQDMLNTIDFINSLNIQGIKFHNLLVLKDAPLYPLFLKHPFHILTLQEYVAILAKQIQKLKPTMIIHRLAADAPKELILEPTWSCNKIVLMNEVDQYLRKHDIHQGDLFMKTTQYC